MNLKRGWVANGARNCHFPENRLSSPMTGTCCCNRCSTTWEPRKPAAPVTNQGLGFILVHEGAGGTCPELTLKIKPHTPVAQAFVFMLVPSSLSLSSLRIYSGVRQRSGGAAAKLESRDRIGGGACPDLQ